jgi:hypothetical protein
MQQQLVADWSSSVENVDPTEVKVHVNALILLQLDCRRAIEVRDNPTFAKGNALTGQQAHTSLVHEDVVDLTANEARALVTISRSSQAVIPSVSRKGKRAVTLTDQHVGHGGFVKLFLSVRAKGFTPRGSLPLNEVVVCSEVLLTRDTHELALSAVLWEILKVVHNATHVGTRGTCRAVEANDVELTVTAEFAHSVV